MRGRLLLERDQRGRALEGGGESLWWQREKLIARESGERGWPDREWRARERLVREINCWRERREDDERERRE